MTFSLYESKRDQTFQTAARMAIRLFLRRQKCRPFLAEEFRAWLTLEGIEPIDWRSLGWVVKDAQSAGLIRRVGSAPARTSHGNWKPKWVGCR